MSCVYNCFYAVDFHSTAKKMRPRLFSVVFTIISLMLLIGILVFLRQEVDGPQAEQLKFLPSGQRLQK